MRDVICWGMTGSTGQVGRSLGGLISALGIKAIELDLSRPPPLGLQRVLHLAAKGPSHSATIQVRSNLFFLDSVIEYCRKYSLPELIFFSTNRVYSGAPREGIKEEEVAPDPNDTYALSKLLGEALLRESGLERVLCLRLPGVLETGRESNFISSLHRKLAVGEPVTITNPDRPFNWFLAPSDLIGFLADLRLTKGFDIVNLASDAALTLGEIVAILKAELKSESPVTVGDTFAPFMNISLEKARTKYGYRPLDPAQALTQWSRERLAFQGERNG